MKDTNGTSWKERRSHHELRNIWSFLCTGDESGKLMPIAHRVEYLKPIRINNPNIIAILKRLAGDHAFDCFIFVDASVPHIYLHLRADLLYVVPKVQTANLHHLFNMLPSKVPRYNVRKKGEIARLDKRNSIMRRVVFVALNTTAPGIGIPSATKKILSDTYKNAFMGQLVQFLYRYPLIVWILRQTVDQASSGTANEENDHFASLVANAQAILINHAQAILSKQKQTESSPNASSTNPLEEDNSATSPGSTAGAKEGGERERE